MSGCDKDLMLALGPDPTGLLITLQGQYVGISNTCEDGEVSVLLFPIVV